MGTEKVSLTLDGQLLAEARSAVGGRGLSGYINRALGYQLQHDRLTGYLAELEKEHGPIDTQVLEEVRRAWPAPEEKPRLRRSA